ncbi:hypothetical protein C0J52_26046 [Blattella germanica]|nr:hypothetical protein C0J52_26046 [Blattella germanica]
MAAAKSTHSGAERRQRFDFTSPSSSALNSGTYIRKTCQTRGIASLNSKIPEPSFNQNKLKLGTKQHPGKQTNAATG